MKVKIQWMQHKCDNYRKFACMCKEGVLKYLIFAIEIINI